MDLSIREAGSFKRTLMQFSLPHEKHKQGAKTLNGVHEEGQCLLLSLINQQLSFSRKEKVKRELRELRVAVG